MSRVTNKNKIQTFDYTAKNSSQIAASQAAKPVGPYPHARRAGDFLFLSGVGPRRPDSHEIPGTTVDANGDVVAHDIRRQTQAVVDNVRAILKEAGATLEDVVDVQVFLTHMKEDFKAFNKVYAEYFAAIGPTRTTVEVSSLPTPIAVEFKVVAYLGEK